MYLLAPPEKAQALDRFFADMPPAPPPDPRLLGDFFLSGEAMLGQLAEIYGVPVPEGQASMTLSDYFDIHLDHAPKLGATLPLGDIVLAAHAIGGERVNVVALRLPGDDEDEEIAAPTRKDVMRKAAKRIWRKIAEG
jgi:cell volume regulation protein A